MKKTNRRVLFTTMILLLFCFLAPVKEALPLNYPTEPIMLVYGFGAGGPGANQAVIWIKRVNEFLSKPIIMEYKVGGAGALAAKYVMRSKPDGHTLWVGGVSPALIAPLIRKDLGYSMDDFVTVCGLSKTTSTINVKKGGPWKSLAQFIEAAKKNPGKYTYTAPGIHNTNHFSMLELSKRANIKMTFVPSEDTAKANTAVMGGHVDLSCTGGTGGLYEGGRLDILANTAPARLKTAPNIPTLTELGYPIVHQSLYFIAAPKGTPREIIDIIDKAFKKAHEKYGDEIESMLNKFEMIPAVMDAAEVKRQSDEETKVFREIAGDLGILVKP